MGSSLMHFASFLPPCVGVGGPDAVSSVKHLCGSCTGHLIEPSPWRTMTKCQCLGGAACVLAFWSGVFLCAPLRVFSSSVSCMHWGRASPHSCITSFSTSSHPQPLHACRSHSARMGATVRARAAPAPLFFSLHHSSLFEGSL